MVVWRGGGTVSGGSSEAGAFRSSAPVALILDVQRPVLVEDANDLPESEPKALAEMLGARSLVLVPIHQPTARGAIVVCDPEARGWGGDALASLEDLADGVLTWWKLQEEAAARRKREDELDLLHSISQAAFLAPDVASAIFATLKQVCSFTGWEYGEAWLPDAADLRLSCAPFWFASRDDPFTRISRTYTFERGVGLPGTVWETGRPIWERDLAASSSYTRLALAAPLGIRSAVGLPVLTGDRVEAVLVFHATRLGKEDRRFVQSISTVASKLGEVVAAKRAEEQLRVSEARFAGIVTMAEEAIVSVDDESRITLFNPAAERLFGYEAAEVLGRAFDLLMPDETRARQSSLVRAFIDSGASDGEAPRRGEVTGLKKNGEEFVAEATIARLEVFGAAPASTFVLRDITERIHAEKLLKAQAIGDELTGLHNRRGFLLLAGQKLFSARRSNAACVLLYLDLDGFKAINDVHGHPEGDVALVETARLLRGTFRDTDVVGRLGGDEFVVLARSGEESDPVAAMCERLQQRFAEANAAGGRPYALACSIGAARWEPEDPVALEELLATADAELLKVKRAKKAANPHVRAP
ncbi:GGDEF domain protein [Vulgatibacter incomptus]|uniref:GGDEF domain protein n=1 Tax=Vulgatibacter incomptus TaxID=1391653 RepID=A0A0K1PJB4_9BACT|nr:GGDEF domain protein [Vulgatibacter incomptus]